MGRRGRTRRPAVRVPALAAVAAAAGFAALVPVAARAQQAKRESVTERPRPEFTPIGLELDEVLYHVGLLDAKTVENKNSPWASFVVHPSTEVATTYDSNIFRAETNKSSDAIFDVRPALAIDSDWANHGAHLDISGDIGRHAVHSSEDYVNYRFNAGGKIDVTEALAVVGDASYVQRQVPRGTPDNSGGVAFPPLVESRLSVRSEARYMADAVLLDAKFNRDDIANSGGDPVTAPDGDRVETKLSLRTGYEFSPGTTVFIEPSYNTRDYARRIDSAGLLQGSSGFDVRAGLSWDVSGATYAELGVGYLRQNFDEPSFASINGPSVDGKLIWNPTGLITVTAGLSRSVNETTEQGVSGILSTDGSLGLDYEYLYNLIVSLRFGYSLQNYEGITRDDTVISGSAGFDYSIGPKWYARLSFGMTRRQSTAPGMGFSDQTLMLALGEHL